MFVPDAQLLAYPPPNQGRVGRKRALLDGPLHAARQRIANAARLITHDQRGHEVLPEAVRLLPVARNTDASGGER